ncbi:hypothetical protein ABTE82_19325, partial [Acinetobacter baumannii]
MPTEKKIQSSTVSAKKVAKKTAPKKTDKPLKKTSTPKAIAAKKNITKKTSSLTITFQIRFHTEF